MINSYWRTIRGFGPDILRYLAFQSATTFAYVGTITVLVNLYLLRLGHDTAFIGTLTAAGMLLWGALALPAGALGARIGLKRAILAALLGMSFSSLLLVGAGWLPPAYRPVGLFAAWLLLWASAALSTVNILPYVMSVTTVENRSYVFSLQQMLAAVVTLTGSLLAGSLPGVFARWMGLSLDHPVPYQMALLLAPIAYLLAAVIIRGAREFAPTAHDAALPNAQATPWLAFGLLLMIVVLQASSDGATRTFFNVYLDSRLGVPVAQIGAIYGLAQIVPAAVSLSIPMIIHRLGARGAMLAATVASTAFILIMALIPNSAAASLALMGLAGLTAIIFTSRSILSQEMVSPRWRTTTSAIATIGMAGGWALSAWQGGRLVETIGFRGLFLTGAALAVLAAAFTAFDGRRAQREEEDNFPSRRQTGGRQ